LTPSENGLVGVESPHVEWIRGTHEMASQTVADKDGRLRLRGHSSLDICASAATVPMAVGAFAGWLDAIEAAGVQTRIQNADGWRVCAVMDGIPLVVRVRERMTRVTLLGGVNLLLERWLGGRGYQSMEPSGRLELQVMRYGVPALSIAFDPSCPQDCYGRAVQGLLELHNREKRYQQKLRSRVEERCYLPRANAPLASGSFKVAGGRLIAEPSVQGAAPTPNSLLTATPADAESILHLLRQLDAALVRLYPSVAENLDLSASLGSLARVCRAPVEGTIEAEAGECRFPLQVTGGSASNVRELPIRKRVGA